MNSSLRLSPDVAVIPLTTVQQALWRLGIPILDADTIAEYKKRAKLGMLWQIIRWQILATAALVGLVGLGRQWDRVAAVGAAAVVLTTLFGWLVSKSELQWRSMEYSTYRTVYTVPPLASDAADALLSCGVCPTRIQVEYLKNDPILFVEDTEQEAGIRRYGLIIW